MKWYFRFVINDGKIVHEKNISQNIGSPLQWNSLLDLYEGTHVEEDDEEPEGLLYYATVDDNDL